MRATLDFLLHDWLRVESLLDRPRFVEHSRETFAQVLDTCERIARDKFAPFNRLADTEEPRVVEGSNGERVRLPEATHDALAAYVASGMLAAAQDHALGGLQLPCVVEMAANAFFSKASVAMSAYAMLTSGNVTPVLGKIFTLTPMFAMACITSIKLNARARNAPKAYGHLRYNRIQRYRNNK